MYTLTTQSGYRVQFAPDRLAFILAVFAAGDIKGITLKYSPIKA